MSILRCEECGHPIDTDDGVDLTAGRWLCDVCIEEAEGSDEGDGCEAIEPSQSILPRVKD